MRAKEFILEGYKEVKSKFSQKNDETIVTQYINKFKQLVDKKQITDINQKNIDYWGKQPFDEFKSFVDEFDPGQTKTNIKRKKAKGQSITLEENDEWLIVIPLDKDASCFHGKESSWCTTKPTQSYFEEYFYDRSVILVYCLQKKPTNDMASSTTWPSSTMWALAIHQDIEQIEIFDQQDNSMSEQQFTAATKLSAQQIKQTIINKHLTDISSSKEKYKSAMSFLDNANMHNNIKNRDRQIEKALMLTKENGYCAIYIMSLFRYNPDVINDIPDPILRIGVKNFAPALKAIHGKSLDFYKDISHNNPDVWEYIPQSEITPDINRLKYRKWLEHLTKPFVIVYRENNPLHYIPDELKDYNLYLQFATNIKSPTEFLGLIPTEFRTEEICNIAYEKDHRNLKYMTNTIKFKFENKGALDLLQSKNINTNGLSEQEIRKILVDMYFSIDTEVPVEKRKMAYDALMTPEISLNTIALVIKNKEQEAL